MGAVFPLSANNSEQQSNVNIITMVENRDNCGENERNSHQTVKGGTFHRKQK